LEKANFNKAVLLNVKLDDTKLDNCNFSQSILSNIYLGKKLYTLKNAHNGAVQSITLSANG
jgi:uncharacterized protein YjbI with pentapeptide repeats